MSSADEIRSAQRATWATLSVGWDAWDRIIMRQLAPVTDAMIERLDLTGAPRHLDIASGTGEPGLTIARLAPRGRVVLTDLSAEMLAVAQRRAADAGVTNIETEVCSADDLPFGDGAFDSVSVRFGYMFFPDLALATAEFVRVLKPGGRLVASVWIDPDANPWTEVLMAAIRSEVDVPPPAPDGPSMFRLAGARSVAGLFERAGLVDVDDWEVDLELVTETPDEYWQVMSEHVSLAIATLQRVEPDTRDRIRRRTIEGVQPYVAGSTVRVPGRARCTVGVRRS